MWGYKPGSFSLIESRRTYVGGTASALIKASALYAAMDFTIGRSLAAAVAPTLLPDIVEIGGSLLIVIGLSLRRK